MQNCKSVMDGLALLVNRYEIFITSHYNACYCLKKTGD